MKKFALMAVLGLTTLLAACSDKLSGRYEAVAPKDAVGMIAIEFTSADKAILVVATTRTEVRYTVDGKNVKIEAAGSNQVLTLQDDGSLQFGSGMMGNVTLRKKP